MSKSAPKSAPKATITFQTSTASLQQDVAHARANHTRRREVDEFVGGMMLDLHNAGIVPSKVKRLETGMSTSSGEVAFDIAVEVTASKDALFAFVHDTAMAEKYFDFGLNKDEWKEQLGDTEMKEFEEERRQSKLELVRSSFESFVKNHTKVEKDKEGVLKLLQQELSKMTVVAPMPSPSSSAPSASKPAYSLPTFDTEDEIDLPSDEFSYKVYAGQDDVILFICSPTELDDSELLKILKDEEVPLHCDEKDVTYDLVSVPPSMGID